MARPGLCIRFHHLARAVATAAAVAVAIGGCHADPDDDAPADTASHQQPETQQDSPDTASRPDDQPAAPASTPPDFTEAVDEVRPAVVNIYTRSDPPDRTAAPTPPPGTVPDERVEESLGSGFIYDADEKLVITNHHVVDGTSEIAARLLDERVFSASIVGTDPPTDLAILRLEEVDDDLPAVELGDSDELQVGNWVLAIGNPLGLASSVTAGITSATGRQVMPPGGRLQFQDFIQTDASINPGSSGGALVDVQGRVVGIATAVSPEGHGVGFAIPVNMFRDIRDDLVEYGSVQRSWLGIYIGEVPSRVREEFDIPQQGGAMLTRTVDDGPAEEAGLEPGDVIVELGGNDIEDPHHLAWLAATLGIDETVDAVVYRGDEQQTIPVTLGELPDNP